jgi:hypothetical protein
MGLQLDTHCIHMFLCSGSYTHLLPDSDREWFWLGAW